MNTPSNKDYALLARYDLNRYVEDQTELVHYKFVEDATDPCVLLDYDFGGADVTCTIRGRHGVEKVNILSLHAKKEDVPPMSVNMMWLIKRVEIDQTDKVEIDTADRYKRLPEMEDDMSGQFTPNLKPSIGNPVFWIWWTIGATLAIGTLNLI